MTIQKFLKLSTSNLEQAGIGTARLDSLVLLEDATGRDRAYLLAHAEAVLQGATLKKLEGLVKRRMRHEPLAFIRGKTEFYGREFIINKDVLEPRPESETMIGLLLELSAKSKGLRIVDVGTGSGALAITAKLELPKNEVIATDIDPKCLAVARQNANKYKVDIQFFQGNLFVPISAHSTHLTALLCNLPYVPDDYKINLAAAMEPRQAIFGGKDGLDLYRQLFDKINRGDVRVQYVFTESLPLQHNGLESIARKAGFKLQKSDDFIQMFVAN